MSPDDVCGVCNTTRENHGDKNHQFNIEGDLVELPKPQPAQNTPPRERGSSTPEAADVRALKTAFAALVEVLAEKSISFDGVNRPILDSKDIIRIFSASSS